MPTTSPIDKIGDIKMPEVTGAQLARLDPSTPYVILLPDRTNERTITELTSFFGKANVMATILVGDPRNFKMFANFPWSVTPKGIQPDIHALEVGTDPVGVAFKRNFMSSVHEDAEAVNGLYKHIMTNGMDTSAVITIEAMVRCTILKFQILTEIMSLITQANPMPPKTPKGIGKAASMFEHSAVLAALVEFMTDSIKNSAGNSSVRQNDRGTAWVISSYLMKLASTISRTGVTEDVEGEVLRLQNNGVLMSGVLTILRADFPAPKATKAVRKAPVKKAVKKK